MSNVSHFNVQGQVIDVKDAIARKTAENALSKANEALEIGNRFTHMRIVVIGDSYGLGVNASANYPELMRQYLGINTGDFFNLSQSGARFSSTTGGVSFNTCLNEGFSSVSNPNTITHVLLAGGVNDALHWSDSKVTIFNDAQTFFNNCKQKFPNAKLFASFIGYRVNRQILQDIGEASRFWCLASGVNGVAYIPNVEYVLHDQSLLGSDKLHPNDEGQLALARYLTTGILGGTPDVVSIPRTVTAIPSGVGSANFNVNMSMVNGQITLAFGNSYINTSADSSRDHNGTRIQIASIPDGKSLICGNQDTNICKLPFMGYAVTESNTILFGYLSLVFGNNTIYVEDYIYSGSGNSTYTGKIKGFRIPAGQFVINAKFN